MVCMVYTFVNKMIQLYEPNLVVDSTKVSIKKTANIISKNWLVSISV